MYKVRIMITIFQGWPRKIPESYTLVAGFLICQYTFQYTSCILRVTGRILGGTWKVCIRNFTVVVEFLLVQATRVSIQYVYWENHGIFWMWCRRDVYWFRISQIWKCSVSLKTPFLSISSLPFLIKHLQIKTWSISILNSTQWKLSGTSVARTIQMELTVLYSYFIHKMSSDL